MLVNLRTTAEPAAVETSKVQVAEPLTPSDGAVTQEEDFDAMMGATGEGTFSTTTTTTAAVAVVNSAPTAVSTRSPVPMEAVADGSIEGEWTEGDIQLPVLRIIAGSGDLSKRFQDSCVILGDEEFLPPPNISKPNPDHYFRFAPIRMVKSFLEVLDQEVRKIDPERRQRRVSTTAEVTALGGTTQWIGNVGPSWRPAAAITVLVEKPAWSDSVGFGMEIDGKSYALAVYYAQSTAFAASAKLIFNAALTSLKVPKMGADGKPELLGGRPIMRPLLFKNWWTWRTTKTESGKYTVTVPQMRMTRDETSSAVRDEIENIVRATVLKD